MNVRQVDPGLERDALLAIFSRHLPAASDPRRFEWLYEGSPDGKGLSWLLLPGEGGDPIGAASAFPRRFRTPEGERKGWVLGDFCIDPGHRTLGPALMLQRALLESLDGEGLALWYDFPSRHMLAVYRRMNILPHGWLLRLVRPLKLDRSLKEAVRPATLGTLAALSGNALLAAVDLGLRLPSEYSIAPSSGRFGDEVTGLPLSGHEVYVHRHPAYLNWRYLDHPAHEHLVLSARKKDALSAYAVFRLEDRALNVVDLFGSETKALGALVRHILLHARKQGMETVTVSILGSSPWVRILKRHGFRERGRDPVILRGDSVSWFLTGGDRES